MLIEWLWDMGQAEFKATLSGTWDKRSLKLRCLGHELVHNHVPTNVALHVACPDQRDLVCRLSHVPKRLSQRLVRIKL
jgi:hypothetical protein